MFKLNNEDCETNRIVNLQTLEVISKRNVNQLHKKIQEEKDYYSNISSHGNSLVYLVIYLATYNFLFDLLSDDAQIKIKHCIENSNSRIAKILGWFIKNNLVDHYNDLSHWLEEYNPKIESTWWKPLLEISDTSEWQDCFCKLISTYYGISQDFYQADDRFREVIKPYLYLFNEKTLIFLLEKIEGNDQTYWRSKSREDHFLVYSRIKELFGDQFDFSSYPNFYRDDFSEKSIGSNF